jgi:hypothetical protein
MRRGCSTRRSRIISGSDRAATDIMKLARCHLRTSHVPRGTLREHVEMVKIRDGLFFASWIDDEMGLLAQIIDFETETVLAAIPVDDDRGTQILAGRLTDPGN